MTKTSATVPRWAVAYQLKVTVVNAPRPTWRRMRIYGAVSIHTLNEWIRRAFGWESARQYKLRVRRPWDGAPKAYRERRLSVCDMVVEGESLSFLYNNGWGWEVHAWVEQASPSPKRFRPSCIGGAGPSLPERPEGSWRLPGQEIPGRLKTIRSEAGEPIDAAAVTACMQRRAAPPAVASAADGERCSVCQNAASKLRETACCGRVVCYDKRCGPHELHGAVPVASDGPQSWRRR
jgi:hypothetical protein